MRLAAAALAASGGIADGVPYLVGAHYYVWYPAGSREGYLRGALRPAQVPVLGEYDSSDPRVAERHIALATAHGIDFFTLDWWPGQPERNDAIDAGFLRAPNVDSIRFCMFYETSALGDQGTNGIVFDAATKQRFVSDMVTLARRYFAHPSYLQIAGRPVILLYVTRASSSLSPGDARDASGARRRGPRSIRDRRRDLLGGDRRRRRPGGTRERRRQAAARADPPGRATTAYNLYIEDRPRHRGYGSAKLVPRRRREALPQVPRREQRAGGSWRDSRVQRSRDAPGARSFRDPAALDRGRSRRIVVRRDDRAPRQADGGHPTADDPRHVVERMERMHGDRAASALTDDRRRCQRPAVLHGGGHPYEAFGTTYVDVVRDHLRH